MDDLLTGLSHMPNLHPLFVHVPVVLWPLALAFCALGLVRGRADLWRMGTWLLGLGTLGGLTSVGTGLWAEDQLGHDSPGHDLVHVHRWFMLTTTALALAASAVALFGRRSESKSLKRLQVALLAATVLVLVPGADRGAEMVFRYGIGTAGEPLPDGVGHGHEHGEPPGPSTESRKTVPQPTQEEEHGRQAGLRLPPPTPTPDALSPLPGDAPLLPSPPPPEGPAVPEPGASPDAGPPAEHEDHDHPH